MSVEDDSVEDLVKRLSEVNRLAEDILIDKHEIIDLDAKRHKCREAYRSLMNQPPADSHNSKAIWMCYGNTFIKMEKKECIRILETDQKTIDEEIETLRDGLKPKVNRLHAMEGKKESKGFQLKGLKEEELFHAAEHYTISSSALNQ